MPRSIALALFAALTLTLSACERATPETAPAPAPSPIQQINPEDLPRCDYPPEVRDPRWLPKNLPLPDGSYTMERLEPLAGYKRVLLVIPITLDELTTFVLEEWPKQGWVLGRGDAEPGEIEDQFSKAPAVGAFKAQAVYCDPGYSVMYLIYAPDRPPDPDAAPGIPSPRGSPLNPAA